MLSTTSATMDDPAGSLADDFSHLNISDDHIQYFDSSSLSVSDPSPTPSEAISQYHEMIFNIVIRSWRFWNVRDISGSLSLTCKTLCRLMRPVVEHQGLCAMRHVGLLQHYQCVNLIIKGHNDFERLSVLLRRHPTYPIHFLKVRLDELTQESADLTIFGRLPPLKLKLEYCKHSFPVTITIPDNIISFTLVLHRGDVKITTSPNAQLQQIASIGHSFISFLHIPPTLKFLMTSIFTLNELPFPQLTSITFARFFNKNVDALQSLPSLTTLRFPLMNGEFNQELNHLPPTLKHLELGGTYTYPLYQLPASLKTLKFVASLCNYQHSFNNLSDQLEYLDISISRGYKLPIFSLPQSLRTLNIQCFNTSTIIVNLPPRLSHLSLNFRAVEKDIVRCELPTALHFLKLSGPSNAIAHLPPNLETLDMGGLGHREGNFLESTNYMIQLINNELPPSIHTLILPTYFNSPFPSPQLQLTKLKRIEFGVKFNQSLIHLPPNVEFIVFNSVDSGFIEFNQPLETLPPNLKELIFSGSSIFDHPVALLPDSLQILRLIGSRVPNSFKQRKDFLRSNLQSKFNQPVSAANLPPRLHTLALGSAFTHPIPSLPSSMCTLVLDTRYPHLNEVHFPHVTVRKVEYMSVKRGRDQREPPPHPLYRYTTDYQPGKYNTTRRHNIVRIKKKTKLYKWLK